MFQHMATGSSQSSHSRSSSIDGSSDERELRDNKTTKKKERTRTLSEGKDKPQRPRAGSDSGKEKNQVRI